MLNNAQRRWTLVLPQIKMMNVRIKQVGPRINPDMENGVKFIALPSNCTGYIIP